MTEPASATPEELLPRETARPEGVSALLRRLPADLYAFLLEHLHEDPDQHRVALVGDTGLGHSRGDYPPDTAAVPSDLGG